MDFHKLLTYRYKYKTRGKCGSCINTGFL